MFRKISANEQIFQETKKKYKILFESFKEFSALETINTGKAKDNKSNRAGSYANYLIRLIIFYEEKHPDSNLEFLTYNDFYKLKSINSGMKFQNYNKTENHFPSATLSTFERFILARNESKRENFINYNLDQTDDNIKDSPFIVMEDTVEYVVKRKNPITVNGLTMFTRNIRESMLAKERASWKCEYDWNHKTFISRSDGNYYVESHHLIPMSYQSIFENTIDFADNIISLCPNCHRKIHFSTNEIKKEMILYFYNVRKHFFPKHGININENSLLKMYDI